MQTTQETQKTTPEDAKNLFYPFLFPCSQRKLPSVKAGSSWEHENKENKPVFRGIDSPLCGLDCGQAGLVVADCDAYKKEFQKSKEAVAFFQECKKKTKFCYQTPSGGWHFFFKQPEKTVGCPRPFPGVEIKGIGGYVCLYQHPAPLGGFEDWGSFYNDLPVWDFTEWGKEQAKQREFGPGKNNTAIPQRAGKAGAMKSFTQFTKDFKELLDKNANRPDFDWLKHGTDLTQKFVQSYNQAPPDPTPPPYLDNKQTKKATIEWVTAPTPEKLPDWLLPDFIPYSCQSVWAGPTGQGRTTTLLNLLTMNALEKTMPGTDQKGDGRPFLYHGPENALSMVQKRVKDAGGQLDKHIRFLQMTKKGQKLPKMMIPKKDLLPEFIKAIESELFSAVICDTLYLLFNDQNKGVSEVLLPISQALTKKKTAFIGVCHLKKQTKDQEIIHHIRGDSDIVTFARSVVYMREGKEKLQRVIVPLKNSFTGEVDTGFVTSMADNNSPITFQHHTENNFKILKEHAKAFDSYTDSPKDTSTKELEGDILMAFKLHGDGKWTSDEFKKWIEKHTQKKWDNKKIQRILGKCGLIRKQKGAFHAIFQRTAPVA